MYTRILPKKSHFANFKAYLDKNIFYTILIMAGGVHMQNKPNIRITPIFDQSVGTVWSDFTRIELSCDREYGFSVNDISKKRILLGHEVDWKCEKNNFAFAAYDGIKIVGFSTGYQMNEKDMYLRNLYVNPKYKGLGIGKALLEQSERSAILKAKKMTVISLFGALGFYEKYGYSIRDKSNCEKKLPEEIIGVVPVFKSIDGLRNVNINLDIDIKDFEQYKTMPMFAYVSLKREIDGLAVNTKTGETKIWTNPNKRGMKDFYEKKLLAALAKVR